jgi:hypothetical protein
MDYENTGLPDEATEDSLVTVAKWGFWGRAVVAAATVLAGLLAAVGSYYGS